MHLFMPSPFGHALAGVAVALAGAPPRPRQSFWRFLTRPLTLLAVALATLPDADLLLRGFHRTATHSITATAVVTIVAIGVTTWVTRRQQSAVGSRQSAVILWTALVCAAAHASHLLTDWLGADFSEPSGIQLLWPFSDGWFTSGWEIFPQVERRSIFSAASMAINVKALIYEAVVIGSIVAALWFWQERSASALRIERHGVDDRHQA